MCEFGKGKHGMERSGMEGFPFPNSARRGGRALTAWKSGCFPRFDFGIAQARLRLFRGIDHVWSLIPESSMWTPGIVAFKPLFESLAKLDDCGVLEDVNLLILHAPPKPLDKDVVHPASFAVHADLHPKA